jgi:hypothetical protein
LKQPAHEATMGTASSPRSSAMRRAASSGNDSSPMRRSLLAQQGSSGPRIANATPASCSRRADCTATSCIGASKLAVQPAK